MPGDYPGVVEALSIYLDGLHHSDTARLRQVFHPRAHYVCATEDERIWLTMEEYFPIVDARPSPASRREARADGIVSIAFAGEDAAFARVNCAIGPKDFTDFLTLICQDGRWRIVSKVFHFEMRSSPCPM